MEHIALRREARLACLELAYDESRGVQMAVADDKGKIFHVLNALENNGQRG